jgi:YHS domain-containing protein
MARAKCQCCKKQLDTKEAFKVEVNGKNKYWCNEECYKITEEEKEKQAKIKAEYDEIFETTKEIFRYEFMGYSLLKKEIVMWEKLSTRKEILEFLKEKRLWLTGLMSKEFQSDFHRVRYYSAVVSSKLHDWKPKVEVVEVPRVVTEEYYETKYKSKGRQALEDFEEDDDE